MCIRDRCYTTHNTTRPHAHLSTPPRGLNPLIAAFALALGNIHDLVAKSKEGGAEKRLREEVREVLRGADEWNSKSVFFDEFRPWSAGGRP